MAPLRDRPTADVVIIVFTCVVAFVVVAVTMVAIGGIILGESGVVGNVIKAVGDLTGSLIALIVGYVAGRGANSNGGRGGTPED